MCAVAKNLASCRSKQDITRQLLLPWWINVIFITLPALLYQINACVVPRLDGRAYAIKKLRLKRDDFELNRKTLREVTSLAKMFHQYIVRYYQAWIEDLDVEEAEAAGSSEEESWLSSSEEATDSWALDP